jgi:hypothetical protein
LLGASGTAAANQTYVLTLPIHDPYTVSGWITTDGAAAPTSSDVVDYKITLQYSGPPTASYILTPANSTFSMSGVTATLLELTLGGEPDIVELDSKLMCPVGGGKTFPCYEIELNTFVSKVFYVVLGFGQTDEVASVNIPRPWAVSSLVLAPIDSLWTNLIFSGKLVAGQVPVRPGVPNLVSMMEAAQRFYDANNKTGTCQSLDGVIQEAREGNQGHSANADGDESASTQIVADAQAIKIVVSCSNGGQDGQD